ncbi:MAG: caspase family protein [Microcoleaceae cyanobacterium]
MNQSRLSISLLWRVLLLIIVNLTVNFPHIAKAQSIELGSNQSDKNCGKRSPQPQFLILGGGGRPEINEIAIEKNILYFQRTLNNLGYDPNIATIFFASGNDGQATIRYIDGDGQEKFKVTEIPNITGESSLRNLQSWFTQQSKESKALPIFFYFTGHGLENPEDSDNHALMLWDDDYLTVQDFTRILDKLPSTRPIVTVMVQCFSGSFANFIYEQGNPQNRVAMQTRCGFFATIKTLPSVGCTPAVNESDYRDYSSSFFAGLSGVSRIGKPVASADYNQDKIVSFAEAHAFAKIDEQAADLPVSTSESWLQEQATDADMKTILERSPAQLLKKARPEQEYVVNQLLQALNLPAQSSFFQQIAGRVEEFEKLPEIQQTYLMRLTMELINIGMEQKVRAVGDSEAIAILEKLLNCEAGSL